MVDILSDRMKSLFPQNRPYDGSDKFLEKFVQSNPYDEKNNSNGVINLGIAWSFICDDVINQKLKETEFDSAQINGKYFGQLSFRQSLVDFYTRKFGPKQPLNPENLLVTNGLTSTLDILAHIIGDRGDVFVTPTPSYAYFSRNFYIRSGVETYPVDILNRNESLEIKKRFELTAEKVDDAIKTAIKKGKTVRAFVLSNPSNPFGDVYPESLVLAIMNVCAKHKIHFVIDECSHLVVFKEEVKFKSVISYDYIPDPQRTHVLWSFTKDLSVGGTRISVVYSYNPEVTNCFKIYSPFYITSTFSQKFCQKIVDDKQWCDEIYFPTYIQRLKDNYQLMLDRLTALGVPVYPVEAGLTLVVSFRKFLKENTFEGEMELLNEFVKHGVYVVPGQFIWCTQPGWYRIVFSFPKPIIELGLKRIESALKAFSGKNSTLEVSKVKSKI